MRVYILFSDDPIFKPRLLHDILIHGNFECCGVGEVASPKRGGFIKKAKHNFQFWGPGPLIYITMEHYLRKIIASFQLLSPSINGILSMKNVCESYKIPFSRVVNVNDALFLNELRELDLDLILSFQHQIFRDNILSVPKIACINCHPALLPAYRGVKPIFWAMLNQESFFGVTVHTMTRKIDCGRIISQVKIPIIHQNTMFQNYRIAYAASAFVIYQAIESLKMQDITSFPIIPESSDYYREPSLDDIKRFKSLGLKLF